MIVVDEYLAARVVAGDWPDGLPDDDDIALTAARHWRLLQRIHKPSGGQLTGTIERLIQGELHALRFPHPEVLHVIDPRPLLDDAAEINARYNAGGLLISESLAAGLLHHRQLWFGSARNVGLRLASVAEDLAITIHVLD
ncbi:MAG: hypothetical protein ACSLFB_04180 [Acidimicrobiales bacterium]